MQWLDIEEGLDDKGEYLAQALTNTLIYFGRRHSVTTTHVNQLR